MIVLFTYSKTVHHRLEASTLQKTRTGPIDTKLKDPTVRSGTRIWSPVQNSGKESFRYCNTVCGNIHYINHDHNSHLIENMHDTTQNQGIVTHSYISASQMAPFIALIVVVDSGSCYNL